MFYALISSNIRHIGLSLLFASMLIACGDPDLDGGSQLGGSIQGTPLELAAVVTTLAGTAASFNQPRGITTNGSYLYLADTDNHTIRQIEIATRVTTTLAGSTAGLSDGTGTAALFNTPRGITTDGTNLYVADTFNNSIRKIVIATGVTTTLAGSTAGASGSANDTGTAARFNQPSGITADNNNLYVADAGNHTIRQIVINTGEVTTLAGTAGLPGATDGAPGQFSNPRGITTDGTNLYVADTDNHTIRQIVIATGVTSTLAGAGTQSGSADGTTDSRFNQPIGITTDGTNLYVADSFNNTIRQVVIATTEVTTLVGTVDLPGAADGTGLAALFNTPRGITTDGIDLYVADTSNSIIRQIN